MKSIVNNWYRMPIIKMLKLSAKKGIFFYFFGGLFILTAVFLWFETPILFPRRVGATAARLAQLEPITISGNVLFVSDFHLRSPKQSFSLDSYGFNNIVVVGDLFDTPKYFARFGLDNEERIQNAIKVLGASGNIYFVSAYNHDPQLPPFEYNYPGMNFFHLGKAAKFIINDAPVIALHGNEIHGGASGGLLSWLGSRVGAPLFLETLAKDKFKIDKDAWFVNGHSHIPGINLEKKVANTGSFSGVPFNAFFKTPTGTGIFFKEGKDPRLVTLDRDFLKE